MRRSLLDKLICPRCEHFPLSMETIEEREAAAPAVSVMPCALYCAREGDWLRSLDYAPPCSSCLRTEVTSGMLSCENCCSHYTIDAGVPSLLTEEVATDWVVQEQAWWDRRYRQLRDRRQGDRGKVAAFGGFRYYERSRYLFGPLRRRGVRDRWLLELGCGTGQYVARLLPPSVERYLYVGTDVSREALRTAAQMVPEGDFVHCAAGRLPFRQASFDALISLGVLHHIPAWQASLRRAIGLLPPGGWLLFNEAIRKPRLLGGVLKRWLGTAVDSPHGGEVDPEQLADILQESGRLMAYRRGATTLRVLLGWLCGGLLERSVELTRGALWLDDNFLRSVGTLFPRFGAAEALGILEKGASLGEPGHESSRGCADRPVTAG